MDRDRTPGTIYAPLGGWLNAENFMANQDDQTNQVDQSADDSKEMRLMWIGSGVIVLLILALMGYNMMYNGNMPPDATEMSSQSRTAPAPAPAQ